MRYVLIALPVVAALSPSNLPGVRMPDGSAIEVIGVCRIVGEGVECWDQRGAVDDRLSQSITRSLRTRILLGDFRRTSKLKSRIVIVRETTDRTGSWSARFAYLKGQVRSKGVARVSWPKLLASGRTPMVSAYQVDMLPKDHTTSMYVEIWKGLGSIPMPPRVGASIRMAGQTLTVKRISTARPGEWRWFDLPPDKVWIERIEFKGKALPNSGATPGISEEIYVGPDGRPASAHDRNAWRRKHPTGPAPFQRVDLTYRSPGPLDVILNIDPRLIRPIRFGGLQTRIAEIKGIRLDPGARPSRT